MVHDGKKPSFWSASSSEMLEALQTTAEGLKGAESSERLKKYGENILKPKKKF